MRKTITAKAKTFDPSAQFVVEKYRPEDFVDDLQRALDGIELEMVWARTVGSRALDICRTRRKDWPEFVAAAERAGLNGNVVMMLPTIAGFNWSRLGLDFERKPSFLMRRLGVSFSVPALHALLWRFRGGK